MTTLFQLLALALDPFNWENIKPTFTILWKGLVAIFAVIFIIILVVQLVNLSINKLEQIKKEREENSKNEPPEKQ